MLGQRLLDRWIAMRVPLLVLALLLAWGAIEITPRLSFDRSVENMFPPESDVLASYQKLKRTFAGNEIVLAVYRDAELFDASGVGIARVTQTRQRLAQVPGVRAVLSIDQPLPGEMIVGDSPLARQTRALFAGYTHGEDRETVSIVCMLHPVEETSVPRRETIDRMRDIVRSLPDGLPSGWLTGEPTLVVDGFRFVEEDGRQLGIWSTVLLGLTIIVCFRSLRWVLIPVVVVRLSLLMTQAILVIGQIRLSMVSSMMTAVIMVVGVATMVHIMVRYTESRSLGLTAPESLRRTLGQLFVPITWACLTDAIGFLALTVSEVGPVQDFGVIMAIGSMMVWLSVLLVVPGLTTLGHFDLDPHTPWGEGQLIARLNRLLTSTCQRPYTVLLTLVLIVTGALLGLRHLRVETNFTRNFRADSEIALAYEFVEDRLGGAGVCDVILPADEQLRWPYLQQLYEFGARLRSLQPDTPGQFLPITNSFSLADAIVELSPVDIGQQPALVQNGLVISAIAAMRGWMPEFYESLHSRDPEDGEVYTRLMLRVPERQDADQKRRLVQQIRQATRAEYPEAEVTGYFVLLSHLIDSVLRDQWRTFLVAVVGIGVLMTVAFRDPRLAIIAILPNAFPVLVVLGSMGWLSYGMWPDLKVNMGTAMIAAVSMGLSIDSSIHYIVGYQRAVREGHAVDEALHRVQGRVGKAMVLSTLALSVGFTVLATSEFVPTVYFGALATLAMLGGLAGNLVGLPLLIHLFHRPD